MKPPSQPPSQQAVVPPDWDRLVRCLPPSWRGEAKRLGAFRRRRKIRSPDDLLRMILIYGGVGLSLQRTAETSEASRRASLSKVALWYRVRAAGPWLEAMIGALLRQRVAPAALAGYQVRIVDGSQVSGPARRAPLRLHYAISLPALTCTELRVTSTQQAESFSHFPVAAGDLLMGDRFYAKAAGLAAVCRAGGEVLVRLGRTSLTLYDEEGVRIDWLAWCRRLRNGRPRERFAQFRDPSSGTWVVGRLCALRLPQAQAAQARQRCLKAGERRGGRPREKTLAAAGYLCLFTTAPAQRLPLGMVGELYRARWQIEISFKRLKSLLHADQLRATSEASARIWLLAKMLYALLLEGCLEAAGAFSPCAGGGAEAAGEPAGSGHGESGLGSDPSGAVGSRRDPGGPGSGGADPVAAGPLGARGRGVLSPAAAAASDSLCRHGSRPPPLT